MFNFNGIQKIKKSEKVMKQVLDFKKIKQI